MKSSWRHFLFRYSYAIALNLGNALPENLYSFIHHSLPSLKYAPPKNVSI